VATVRTFDLRDVRLPDDELISAFVSEYYGLGSFVPDEVLIPIAIEGQEGLAELLSEQRGHKVTLNRPQRGSKAQLLRMAMENAAHAWNEKARAQEDLETRLRAIADKLGLAKLPRRFECIDVSHTGGKDTVAAIVAFRDGEPDRKRYRSFHIRSVSGGDDYGAMREALTRRFKRGKAQEVGWDLPDLLVLDGGRGQLGIALAVLEDLGIAGLPVVALAKEKQNVMGDELVDRVYVPGRLNPVEVRSSLPALGILAQARDEAHRVSNSLRLRLGKGLRLRSQLDDVPFVGKKTRVLLLRKLGSFEAVSAASMEELIAAGATTRQGKAIFDHLHRALPETENSEEYALENAFETNEESAQAGDAEPLALDPLADEAEQAEALAANETANANTVPPTTGTCEPRS
jgi:excinuclease ABC subunit C